jgi:hypothetical protein
MVRSGIVGGIGVKAAVGVAVSGARATVNVDVGSKISVASVTVQLTAPIIATKHKSSENGNVLIAYLRHS